MRVFRVRDAAILADASYIAGRIVTPAVRHTLNHDDVQAYVVDGDILLMPGSNSVRDYLKYNLRFAQVAGHRFDPAVTRDPTGTLWHQGFLRYAGVVHQWLQEIGVRPKFIIGHSLGAAAAQILSVGYNVPAIGFAAPRPTKTADRENRASQCLLINRADDLVPKLPGRFHHMGQAMQISTPTDGRFIAHAMPRYLAVLDAAIAAAEVPEVWGG